MAAIPTPPISRQGKLEGRSVKALSSLSTVVSLAALLLTMPGLPQVRSAEPADKGDPIYDKDGNLLLPKKYREWIFLSSGIDMSYGPNGVAAAEHSVFDNVFVDPKAYRYFLANGTWPDKTMMILEVRGAEKNISINHGGRSQGGVTGLEVHLKDASRFPADGWAFFDVKPTGVGTPFQRPATCYSCHRDHAAVATTFVQFYPTLLPIAETHQTLNPNSLKGRAR